MFNVALVVGALFLRDSGAASVRHAANAAAMTRVPQNLI